MSIAGRRRSGDFELERRQVVGIGLEEAFAFFSDPTNLEKITPPWLGFRIVEAPAMLRAGSILRYRVRLLGVPVAWTSEIVRWQPPRGFTDVQRSGPYPLWEHTHRLAPLGEARTEIYDHVRYRVPGGPLAGLVHRLFVAPQLREIFDYRAERLPRLLA